MSAAPPSTTISIGALEGAGVAALGAFASTYAASMSIKIAVVSAVGAAAAFLGYHAYQSS